MKLGEKIKPVRVPTRTVGEVQLPDAMAMMSQMVILFIQPSKDQVRLWLNEAKHRVALPNP